MINMRKISTISGVALGTALLAGTAFAGPRITFGPEDQGALQIDYKGQFQMTVRDNGSGADGNSTTTNFNFRRNRLAFMGKYGDMVSLYVQTEFTEDPNVGTLGVSDQSANTEFQLLDAVVRFKLNDAFRVNVGKFKYGFSRENLEACEMPLTLDRSLFIRAPFVSTRDMGVGIWGNVLEDKIQYRADVMEGRKAGDEDGNGHKSPDSSFRYTFRGHVSLLDPESDYGYKGTYMGKKQVLTFGAAYQFEPDVVYGNPAAKSDKKDYQAWTVDGFFEYPVEAVGTFTLSAAYADYDLDKSYNTAINALTEPDKDAIGLNGEKNGWYMKAGYMLPNLPLQFFGRYEKWSFAMLNNIYDQDVTWYGGGVNYYIWGQNLKLTAEISRTDFDKEGVASGIQGTNLKTEDFTTFVTQLQLLF
ncbi:phosphate-selective porin O and P [Geobacter metallireducens RCH3]|uniref:Outer membrane channel, putative n=1 Tax=Geobacter metallireducens (strain ATCC 53774 / DSM 7210 / GS-15) TaxID=269799 RepID=Q39Y99_GEOMG|nr:selenite/tellurite reduction operon porin ExtI [Geobacter metallireducens]ABB30775.1 outer membrane channel, putative [Geobacter metallireducens GS-15]EHP88186.1 phosphate-selective porin O and P [Geobacter metallireducens RCH3]